MWEDIDNPVDRGYEEEILSLLDGEHRVDRIVYIATTNYLKKLPARMINRPSRFDKRFFIDVPNDACRRVYLEHIIGRDKTDRLKSIDEWLRVFCPIKGLRSVAKQRAYVKQQHDIAEQSAQELRLDGVEETSRGYWVHQRWPNQKKGVRSLRVFLPRRAINSA